ncbi:MAG: FecR family protein [Sumerlaeia bacterium]
MTDLNLTEKQRETERLLEKAGSEWAAESAPDSGEFLASFEARLAEEEQGGFLATVVSLRPALAGLAAAAIILAVFGGLLAPRKETVASFAFATGSPQFDLGGAVASGTTVETSADSRVILALAQNATISLDTGTRLRFDGPDTVYLADGEIWVSIARPGQRPLRIVTPHGKVYSNQESGFCVVVAADDANVFISRGEVHLADASLKPGLHASLTKREGLEVAQLFDAPMDPQPEWSRDLLRQASLR